MKYRLCGLTIDSQVPLASFAPFRCEAPGCDLAIGVAASPFPLPGEAVADHRDFAVHRCPEGWLYHAHRGGEQLLVSDDYTRASLYLPPHPAEHREVRLSLLLRVLIECRMAQHGMVSLHSACVLLDDQALAFTAPSGTGKSTRATMWERVFGASLLSGDRPAISVPEARAFGVPWDGKEQLFRNLSAPLRAVLDVRRGHAPLVRRLSRTQAQRLLMQQCFLPMWDSDAAALVMTHINQLARSGLIFRMVCSASHQAAQAIHDILYHHPEQIKEEALDMKIKEGFVLRNLVGEYMVMPTGANVAKFQGSVALNEVSAFIFKKLETPIAEEDLLEQLLAEYDVERETAQADLTRLLNQFREYGMLDEQP